MSEKSKEEQLLDSCLQSTLQINNLVKSQLKQQHFGDYIAQEMENFDDELLLLAKNKINNVIFEISQMQLAKTKNSKN